MTERTSSMNASNRAIAARTAVLFLLGLAYVFSIPMFHAPDEPFHFARAHSLAEGRIVLKDHAKPLVLFIHDTMKKSQYGDHPIVRNMKRLLDEHENRIPSIAWHTALYSPVPYLAHAGVIRIVMAFGDSPREFLIASYLCRLTTLCLFIGFIHLASRVSPETSRILFWVAAAPMALAQASVVNIDFVVLGSSALLLSTCLGNLRGRAHAVYLILSSFLLMTSKPTYLPLLLIPAGFLLFGRGDARAHGVKPFLTALSISMAGFLAWSAYSAAHDVFIPNAEGMKRFFDITLDPSFQFKWILRSPLQFLMILTTSLASNLLSLARQIVGVLGWQDFPIPVSLVVAWWAACPATILVSAPPPGGDGGKRLYRGGLFIAAAIGVVLCIYISGFMMWTPVGAESIVTLGRYFHPVVLALFLGLAFAAPAPVNDSFRRWVGLGLPAMAAVINLGALFATFL